MCLREYDHQDELQHHLAQEKHFGLPDDRSVWDQPGYVLKSTLPFNPLTAPFQKVTFSLV